MPDEIVKDVKELVVNETWVELSKDKIGLVKAVNLEENLIISLQFRNEPRLTKVYCSPVGLRKVSSPNFK